MAAINLMITSPLLPFPSEKRFPLDTTVAELKNKLELIVGAPSSCVLLELREKDGKTPAVASMEQKDAETLGSLGAQDGMVLNVVDPSGAGVSLINDDDSMVEKYELSAEQYAQRADSVLAWKQREGLGRFGKEAEEKAAHTQKVIEESEKLAAGIKVGSRCRTKLTNQPEKRGVVSFVGKTQFKPGYWVGVRYDEPLGRNDGSVDGKRYFECPLNYGAFVRPSDVEVGDFPEIAIEGHDNMDEM